MFNQLRRRSRGRSPSRFNSVEGPRSTTVQDPRPQPCVTAEGPTPRLARRPPGPGQPPGQSLGDSALTHEMGVRCLSPTPLCRDNMPRSLCQQGLWHPAHRGLSVPPVSPQPSGPSPQTPGKTEGCRVGDRAGLHILLVFVSFFCFVFTS